MPALKLSAMSGTPENLLSGVFPVEPMTNALGGGHARLLCWCSEELRQGGRVIEGKEAYEVAACFVKHLDIGTQHRCPGHKGLQ